MGPNTRLSAILRDAGGAFERCVLWIMPCGVTLMNAWRVTPPARTDSTRAGGFAAAKKARKASAATGINPVKLRRLKNADCAVCFVFIGLSYGRGGGVGRGLGVSAGLGVGEGLGVEVGVAVGVAVAVTVGVAVGVVVGVCVGVIVAVAVGVGVVVVQVSVYC